MYGMLLRVFGVVLAVMFSAQQSSAQLPLTVSFSSGGYFMNLNTEEATGEQRLSGFGIGGNATAAFRRLGLGISYMEGSLSPNVDGRDRDIVEGEAMISLNAASWLRFAIGPHIRSLIIPEGTERWLFWEGRVQTKARLGSPRLESTLELWQVLSANVDVDDPYDGGRGIEGSLRWEISALPLWIGLGYRIDRSNLGGGSRTEVMEHFLISFGVGRGAL